MNSTKLSQIKKLEPAARTICQGMPPRGFMAILHHQASLLASMAEGYEKLPTRTLMLKELEEASTYARKLSEKLDKFPEFAATASSGETDFDWHHFTHQLQEFSFRIRKVISEIPDGRGRTKLPAIVHGKAISHRAPQLVCAVIVASAWQAARGREIVASDADAQQAAADLWDAASLPTTGMNGAESSLASWERWLSLAKKVEPTDTEAGTITPGFVKQWRSFSP